MKNGTRTLYVFDMDGTLFNSGGSIQVKQGDKVVKTLGHGEFNTHKLETGQSYDFSQFRSSRIFRDTASPITTVLDQAKDVVRNLKDSSKTIILTARSDFDDHEEVKRAFRDHGFPIDEVDFVAAGNLEKLKPGAKPHITKAVVLKKYILSNNFDRIKIWDDSKKNLEMLISLAKYNPKVEITGYLVDKNGNVQKYNTMNEETIQIPYMSKSLDIARSRMPQISHDKRDQFFSYLKEKGIKHETVKVTPRELLPTQKNFSKDIVANLMAKKPKLNAPMVSSDNYILDGHHRWLADYNTDKNGAMRVIRIDLPINELLKAARGFEGVKYRTLEQSKKGIKSIKKVVKEAITEKRYTK